MGHGDGNQDTLGQSSTFQYTCMVCRRDEHQDVLGYSGGSQDFLGYGDISQIDVTEMAVKIFWDKEMSIKMF
jgi:hypothetical protein